MADNEKQQSQKLYNICSDPGILEKVRHCEQLCFDYNHTPPRELDSLSEQLKHILGTVGKNARIIQPLKFDYGYNIHVGDDFFANCNLVILDGAPVTFGDHVFIGPNCAFYTAGHPLDAEQRNQGVEIAKPITVGSNVWIGGNVCVMPGVTIGDGSVIGGGSVVVNDIPPHVLALGNPCVVIRPLNEEHHDEGHGHCTCGHDHCDCNHDGDHEHH